ncbi:rab-GTPase-TBC domain-domain-containing protein [Naematelia encephala]|uniref:Rab-GTPase-TBC domain-domain-containing protein n=1 Tax=Naematelia encephala TaxID=71784 RepID=A0A1Y2BKN8_9TREE|nr:rab-GTPase-TBC domain-domain-containing protein [Naematelia encephala]
MAESSLSRLLSAESSSNHPLSPSVHPARIHSGLARNGSSTPSLLTQSVPPAIQTGGYFDLPNAQSSHRRHHAATISGLPNRSPLSGLPGHLSPSLVPAATALSIRATPASQYDPVLRDPPSPGTARPWSAYADSLSKDDLAVLETRFDLMTDAELREFTTGASTSTPSGSEILTPRVTTRHSRGSETESDSDGEPTPSPLFPPSPPSGSKRRQGADHPLRVLSRAVRELRETVEALEEENALLRAGLGKIETAGDERPADQVSIHDNLTEALSTSLTSNSPLGDFSSPPLLPSSKHRGTSPAPSTTRSLRAKSPSSSISVPFASSPHESTSSSVPVSQTASIPQTAKRNGRSSWTSGLWVWNTAKQPRPRKGSNGSTASLPPPITVNAFGGTGTPVRGVPEEAVVDWEEDDEAWRKGDGGSSPSFRAIFLATRIITPDPSSILNSPSTPPNSLVAYLAHSLVSNARDAGFIARDAPGKMRSTRSRAASASSQEAPSINGTPAKNYGYGDQALAVGRSLLSSVSTATLRAKAISSSSSFETPAQPTRPSLLSRVSSSRPFPTTAVSPPAPLQASSSSAASPTEDQPLPSVELSSIVPDETRPPTVLLSRQNLGTFFQSTKAGRGRIKVASRFNGGEEPLTDRYGFIYDIQHASMLKDANAAGTPAPASLNGTMHLSEQEGEGWIDKQRRVSQDRRRRSIDARPESSRRSTESGQIDSPRLSIDSASTHSPDPGTKGEKKEEKPKEHGRHRATTLNLAPSPAKPLTAKDTLTVSARGSGSLQTNIAETSSPLSASLAHASSSSSTLDHPKSLSTTTTASRLTVSSLLDQLTELHDQQQKERMVEWDAFLRRRQRHLAASNSSTGDKSWASEIVGISQMGHKGGKGLEDWKVFTRLVRGGIPLAYRSDVWAECSGAKDAMVPGEYAGILKKHEGQDNPVLADIEKDVGRTFPGNVFFGGDGPGVAKLRRVLVAYSWHNPEVGYCQGMNMLAATLLLTHTDEEQAFWTLRSLIESLLPPQFFAPTLLGSRADQRVLDGLVAHFVPRVHAHLVKLGCELASLTFGWWLSLFTDCLPVETLFRVWDVFFVEGHDSLFRVALAMLKLNETELCACETISDLFAFVGGMTARLWGADKLIAAQHGYKQVIRHQDLVAKCAKARRELEEEAEEQQEQEHSSRT